MGEPSKFKPYLFAFMVFSSLYAISTTIVTILAFMDLSDAADEVGGIIRNWSISPIINVELKQKSQSCSTAQGFEEARTSWNTIDTDSIADTLGGKMWRDYGGVVEGCECWTARKVAVTSTVKTKDANGNTKTTTKTTYETYYWHYKMNREKCSSEQITHGCHKVPELIPFTSMHLLRGYRLCVQRSPSSATPMKRSEEKKDNIDCNSDAPYDCQENDGARPYCAIDASNCPIFGLHLIDGAVVNLPSGFQEVPISGNPVGGNNTQQTLQGSKKLIFTRSPSKARAYRSSGTLSSHPVFSQWNNPTPLVELGVESCYTNPHVLGTEENECGTNDIRSFEFDRDSANTVLQNELQPGKWTSLTTTTHSLHNSNKGSCSSSPGTCVQFKPEASNQWRFTQQPQVYWSKACAEAGYVKHTLKDRRNPVDDVVWFQWFVVATAVMNTIANLILCYMFGANYLCEKDWSCFPGDGHEEFEAMEKYRKYQGLCCKFIVLPFTILAYLAATKVEAFFAEVKDEHCSDQETNATIITLSEGLTDVVKKNFSAMLMTAFAFTLEILLVLWGLKRKKDMKNKILDSNTKVAPKDSNNDNDDNLLMGAEISKDSSTNKEIEIAINDSPKKPDQETPCDTTTNEAVNETNEAAETDD